MNQFNLSFSIFFMFIIFNAQKPKLAPSKKVIDEFFGVKIEDEYRNLESLNDLSTFNWIKSETKYSLSMLENIPNRQYYIDKRLEFDKKKLFSVSHINVTENNFCFYLKQKSEEYESKLFFRKNIDSNEREIFNPKNYKPENNKNYQINYIKPNYDGSMIAIALTENGKEISEMVIYDLMQNKLLPYVITNCWPSDSMGIVWLENNKSFMYRHYPVIDPNADLFLKNMKAVLYTIGEDPKKLNILFSKESDPNLKINSEDFPRIVLPTKECKYLFGQISGATSFQDTYYKKLDEIYKRDTWKLLFTKDEKISAYIVKGDSIIFISEKNNSNAIYTTSLQFPNFKDATLLISNITDETINGIYATKNGFVFSASRNGVEAKLYLYKGKEAKLLTLPIPAGDISVATQDSLSNDFWITCSGWKNEYERFKYSSSRGKFIAENLSPLVEYPEFKDIVVEEITVKSHDGLDIPLSLIYKKGVKKNNKIPLLIDAYGAYGYNSNPYFAKTYLLWALQDGIVAIAHVRGGGEKGEKWHKGGYKTTKPNSWKDLISCAEYMINEHYTSPENIAIWGGSAGGITIGRAMTERPDLFKAAIIDAGIVNASRMEFTPNGLNSVKEFGSLKIEPELKALIEMDAYQHIKKGVKYPATLITSGINDPRVSPWIPTKFAAKLMAYNISDNPILLKIDFEGGHGGDIPLVQKYDNLADSFAFALWQLGHPDYQPK